MAVIDRIVQASAVCNEMLIFLLKVIAILVLVDVIRHIVAMLRKPIKGEVPNDESR